MEYFNYDKSADDVEYYETLLSLMERWEYETVEFKEAKGGYNEDKIGQYFSAISNEANLKNRQYGWFVLGISENGNRHPVGTSFKKGDSSLMEKFKYEISRNLTDGMSFLDIIELFPVYREKPCRVLMFKVPAAVAGMPTAWKNRYYARNGESLCALQQYKIDTIRNQERRDWSKQAVHGAGVEHLDPQAILQAREKYKEKMNRPHISEEVDKLSDTEFLTKIKLLQNGKVTNAAMLLLGKEECDYLLERPPVIMWRLYDKDGIDRDYEIYNIPFINVVDKMFTKIRNLTYRYMPNQLSLFPKETQQYDMWILRELLNNAIAHANYQLGGRIYLNEFDDHIIVTNPGDFLPPGIESVLKPGYNPPFYRNQLLAETMVRFHMIDTETSGIKKIYRIQKAKYFPMPDYDFETYNQVGVTIYGKTLDDKYTFILYDNPDLDLETIYLLDQVQKGQGGGLSKEAVSHLRKHKLVEGRKNQLFLSAEVAQHIEEEAKYIKNKAFNDQYYRDMILQYLKQYGKAQKKDIRELLWDKLPDVLDDKKKNSKISTLLTSLRMKGLITTDSKNQQTSYWVLVRNADIYNKKR